MTSKPYDEIAPVFQRLKPSSPEGILRLPSVGSLAVRELSEAGRMSKTFFERSSTSLS